MWVTWETAHLLTVLESLTNEQNTTTPAELQCIFRRISACHLTWKKKSIHNVVPEHSSWRCRCSVRISGACSFGGCWEETSEWNELPRVSAGRGIRWGPGFCTQHFPAKGNHV